MARAPRSPMLKPPRAKRPAMPGYGVPKGAHGLLRWSWAEQRLKRSHNYWLVSVHPGGRPHAMPVWGVWVDQAFYFSTGTRSRKARNLAENAHCVVCTEDAAEAVVVEGVAQIATGSELDKIAAPYRRKYQVALDPALGPVFAVRPLVAFGLDERRFQASATKWVFAAGAAAETD